MVTHSSFMVDIPIGNKIVNFVTNIISKIIFNELYLKSAIEFLIYVENFEAIRQLNLILLNNNPLNVNKNAVINCFHKVRKYSNKRKKNITLLQVLLFHAMIAGKKF